MFSKRIPDKHLAEWLRSLSSCLSAGLSLVDTFRTTGKRGRPNIRALSLAIRDQLKQGEDFSSVLRSYEDRFPPLFVAMADVASHTGNLPEVFKTLEKYFTFQVRLRRQLISQLFWPVTQLVAAILIVAFLIFILGIIASTPGRANVDFLGLGLTGSRGAMLWLFCWFGGAAFCFFAYQLAREVLGHATFIDRLLLKIPVVGSCMQSIALSRICLAMGMTLDTKLGWKEAIPLSLSASDNHAYSSLGKPMVKAIKGGANPVEAFEQYPVFPEEFLSILSSGQETGTIPELMSRMADHYTEVAEQRMTALNVAAGWVVWSIVAGVIIFIIFRIALGYIGMINEAVKGF